MVGSLARVALAGTLVASALRPGLAVAQSGCAQDTFTIDGSAVAVAICPSIRHGAVAALTETVTVRGQAPLVREVALDSVGGDVASHVLDDVPLQKLGLARTLHLALGYRSGVATLDHALLVPGAVRLK
jgi:hypothetical protein